MKTIHPLHKLALAVAAGLAMSVSAQAINLLPNSDFVDGPGGLLGWTTSVNPPAASVCCSGNDNFVVTGEGVVYGPFDGDGPLHIRFDHSIALTGGYATALLHFDWNPNAELRFDGATKDRVFQVQIVNAANAVVAVLYSYDVRAGTFDFDTHTASVDVTAALNGLAPGNYTFRFDSNIPESFTGSAAMAIAGLSFIALTGPENVYQKGDPVPGAGVAGSGVPAGAKFSSLGVPAINDYGVEAVLGKWTSPTGSGAGIFAKGRPVATTVDDVPGMPGVKFKSFKDPVIDDKGFVAFPAKLTGSGITAINDTAVVSNGPNGGAVSIVAQEGGQAAEQAAGVLYKSFSSVAILGHHRGALFLCTLTGGGTTSATANMVVSVDGGGGAHTVLRSGTTAIGGRTVKSFAVLKAPSGSPGQTHAFDSSTLAAKVTYGDGIVATVLVPLP